MICYSFELCTPEGAVFYSADTSSTEALKQFIADHSCIHRIYVETYHNAPSAGVHLSPERLAQILPDGMSDKVWLMHINGPECFADAKRFGFHVVSLESE